MSNKTGSIIKQLQTTNEQSTFYPISIFDGAAQTLDWKLAYYIYLFLVGRSNSLPSYEYMDRVIQKSEELFASNTNLTNRETISIGAGTVVSFYYGALTIESEEPISPATNRYDRITCNEYCAYVRTIQYVDGDARGRTVEIDVEEMPKYEERRIQLLQKHLKGYMEYKKKPKTK